MARGNFGERLKRERELREVTLEEITSATRIGPRFLEALENEEWEKLPGGVFNRGFVRSVARYLGLDEESFLAEYDLAHGPVVQPTPQHSANHFSSRPKWIPFVAFLAVLVVAAALAAGGYYAWRYYVAHRAAKQSSFIPPPTPSTSAIKPAVLSASHVELTYTSATAKPSATQIPLDLFVSLAANTHLQILADGKLVINADLSSGSNHHFPANEQFEITAENSSALYLEMNGQAMPPLGAPGAPGSLTWSRKDLKAAATASAYP
jgi:cytoskeleton protein RodZ